MMWCTVLSPLLRIVNIGLIMDIYKTHSFLFSKNRICMNCFRLLHFSINNLQVLLLCKSGLWKSKKAIAQFSHTALTTPTDCLTFYQMFYIHQWSLLIFCSVKTLVHVKLFVSYRSVVFCSVLFKPLFRPLSPVITFTLLLHIPPSQASHSLWRVTFTTISDIITSSPNWSSSCSIRHH